MAGGYGERLRAAHILYSLWCDELLEEQPSFTALSAEYQAAWFALADAVKLKP